MRRRTPEGDVVRACLDLLKLYPRITAWRQNTGALAANTGGKSRFIRFGTLGAADITGLVAPEGTRLEVECKAPRGKQSDTQKQFEEMIVRAGGIYLLVHSADELMAELTEAGIGR